MTNYFLYCEKNIILKRTHDNIFLVNYSCKRTRTLIIFYIMINIIIAR